MPRIALVTKKPHDTARTDPEDPMHAKLSRIAIALAVIAFVATAAGCSKPAATTSGTPTVTPVPTTTAEPTAPAAPGASESSGPITTPATGTALRTAILAAVKSGLDLSGTPTVNQLFVQGGAAVGDVSSSSGARRFFALTGGPDSWTVAWSARSGSSLATVDSLVGAVPEVSADLAGSLDFAKTVKKPSSSSSSTTKAPTLASFKTFALGSAKSYAGASFTGTFTVTATIAKDSTGSWWGNATMQPSDDSLEPIGVWGHYVGGKWKGEIADFGDDSAAAGYFPGDVLTKLGL